MEVETHEVFTQEYAGNATRPEAARFLAHSALYRVTTADMKRAIEAIAPGTSQTFATKLNTWLKSMMADSAAAGFDGYRATVNYPDYPAHRIQAVRNGCGL